jgi:hypothetical protein
VQCEERSRRETREHQDGHYGLARADFPMLAPERLEFATERLFHCDVFGLHALFDDRLRTTRVYPVLPSGRKQVNASRSVKVVFEVHCNFPSK